MNPEDLNLNPGDYLPDDEIERLFGDFQTNLDPSSTTGAGPSSSTLNKSKKRKQKKSEVWDCFKPIMLKQADGTEFEKAQCKYCQVLLSTANGTSHLRRHQLKCMGIHGQVDTTRQTQLQKNPDGSVTTWQYDPDRVRENAVLYCAATDQPLGFQESPHFKSFINTSFNPNYVPVTRNTVRSDLIRTFQKRRTELISELQNISFSIALTSDIWSGRSKQDYLCVTGHYVDTKWILQKKLLGFRVMDYSHNAQNIFQVIMAVIQDYGIHNRIMSITLDNASANSKAIDYFIHSNIPNIAGKFFHARCACHIINLIVKSGLKQLESYIDNIRGALGWMMASNQRIAEFGRFCTSKDLIPRKFQTDMPIRWNSTYTMLTSALPYAKEITSFYNLNTANDPGRKKLTDGDWYVASVFVEFLKVFYDSTVELSGVYYPTSPLALHKLYDMADLLRQYSEHATMDSAVANMQKKFIKYWGDIPLLYAFGIVIDPRFRFNGLEVFSKELGKALGLSEKDVAEHLSTLKSQMFEVFSIYENRYTDGTAEPAPPQQQSQQQSKLMRIFFNKATTSRASGSSSQNQGQRQHVELNRYLTTEYSITDNDDFTTNDLLKWWRGKRNSFPILSILACDILAIPVSTVSSEQVFSTAGQILGQTRCSLAPDAVEALTCLKDWENARFKRQHELENKELMDDFSTMTIDESSGSNQPTS